MDEEKFNTSGDIDHPVDVNPEQPINNNGVIEPVAETTTQPETVVVSEVTTVETAGPGPSNPENTVTTTDNKSSKSHKGLIAIIIAILLLGCGGAFAAFAIIKNQPENIALESFSNLLNAKQVAVTGSFNFTPGDSIKEYIGPINVKINAGVSNLNQSYNTNLTIDHPELNQPINLEIGEVIMSDGVFYIKASGLQKIYDEIVDDILTEYLQSQLELQYKYTLYDTCDFNSDLDTYLNCIDQEVNITDPAILASIQSQITTIQNHVANIIEEADDEWFEFSINDIINSDIVKENINQNTENSITNTYDCLNNIKNNTYNYTGELSNLYSDNQFMILNPDQDSYYKVTFDVNKLANYTNAVSRTKLVKDIASCSDIELTDDMYPDIKSDDIGKALELLPDIYARFDGFFDHHLTDLKISKDYNIFSISSDLSFVYPSNLVISAPADSTPVMELVEDIMQELEETINELDQ